VNPVKAISEDVTLLIDGDVIAFKAAAAAQKVYEDRFGYVQPFANRVEGEAIVDNIMIGLELSFKSSHMRVALSDPKDNWRLGIYPDYKSNRKDSVRPLLLTILKDYLRAKYQAFHWDGLEADDVLGILNTEPQDYPGKRVLVGFDKDFKTIPGLYHQLGQLDAKSQPVVQEISEWEAIRWHMMQTLMGDAVDGYPGCRLMGKTRAEALVDSPVLLTAQHGVKTSGKNKGAPNIKWVSEPTRDYWASIVSHFKKGGDTEEFALTMARIAHILQHRDYDRETGSITLWTPQALQGL
jgi:DNA polymerase-1